MPNATGGLIVISPNVQKVGTGYTARRAIVDDKKCNACHQELGTFTEDAFHAGQRNEGTTCSWCHTPNRTSSAWSADSLPFVHAIHAAAKRTVPYNWHAISADEGFWQIGYPGVLNDCETCHLPNTYTYNLAGSRQLRTVGTGTYTAGFTLSPYVTPGVNYGAGFSYSTTTGLTTEAAATTLVVSPLVSVCSACHDSDLATGHFKANGGTFYEPRSTAATRDEQCMLCHGPDRTADIKVMHSKR